MIMLPADVKIFICAQAVDMRRSFAGLSLIVQEELLQTPTSGHLFVFVNKRGDKIKILYWDQNGFAMWYKQLARGVFRLPRVQQCECFAVTPSELGLLLEGIDLTHRERHVAVHQTLIN